MFRSQTACSTQARCHRPRQKVGAAACPRIVGAPGSFLSAFWQRQHHLVAKGSSTIVCYQRNVVVKYILYRTFKCTKVATTARRASRLKAQYQRNVCYAGLSDHQGQIHCPNCAQRLSYITQALCDRNLWLEVSAGDDMCYIYKIGQL